MLFNSYQFIFFFLPIVLVGTFVIGHRSQRAAVLWLCLASLVFYGAWDYRYVPLLLASVAFNYSIGSLIGNWRSGRKDHLARGALIAAIVLNLATLGYFKYANFLLDSANSLVGSHLPILWIILPLGISFFTFTQIAYLVDVYRGIAQERDLLRYLLFVTYFPHLIAGPVLHHKQMMPQFAEKGTFRIDSDLMAAGFSIFVLGLSKKVLLADHFAEISSPIFDAFLGERIPLLFEAWTGAFSYTLQLYFDFSGYCDMAIGLSLMFNVRLPLNFNSPYKAMSIVEFWRRWNMTLSMFLRDYLYIPLGGNRKGPGRRYANLMATMLIGGLWHGAGWTFVLWGGLHGLYLIVNHAWEKVSQNWLFVSGWFSRLGGAALTFVAVVIGWVVFRANNLHSAAAMLASMFGLEGISMPYEWKRILAPHPAHFPDYFHFDGFLPSDAPGVLVSLLVGLLIIWLLPNVQQMFASFRPVWESSPGSSGLEPIGKRQRAMGFLWELSPGRAVLAGLLFFLCLAQMFKSGKSEFLYFQF